MSATSVDGLLALCGSFIGLSTITVALRTYGRTRSGSRVGIDCWIALFGVATFIGACACAIEFVVLHTDGYDESALTPAQAAARAKPTISLSLAYDFLIMNTLACAKLSALFLYRHLFNAAQNRLLNVIIWTTVIVIAAWYITFDVLSLTQCRSHFSAPWHGEFEEYCDLNLVWANGLAISDLILDIWVLLLPVPLIWRLQLSVAKKLSIVGVFLLAFVGVGASIARVVIFFIARAPGSATLYIGVLEAGMTITVVNLPSIWYVFTSTLPKQVRRGLDSWSRMRGRMSLGSRKSSNSQSNATGFGDKTALHITESERTLEV